MLPFSIKQRGMPSDLPLNDVAPLQKYIGTSGGYWKIYQSHLISSHVEVSVFIFDKAICSKHKQKKVILNSVNKHVDMVQNIEKYSNVTLKILLTAKENRRYIAYATEPVLGSLANVLGDYPNDICRSHASVLNKMSLCEMEIKYGVVAIAETLSYLHLYEAMIHCDVSPRNIIVCANGAWRLSGFHFLMKAEAPHTLTLSSKSDSVIKDFLQPDINFAAPCLFFATPTPESDIFSLGMLITCVYNNGISLIEGTAILSELHKNMEMHDLYNERISSAYNAIKSRIPEGLRHGLSKMISFDVDMRPTAQQLLMLGYYHDPLIKYLKRLNSYENLSDSDKGVVLSTELPECARALPQAMLLTHVMPILTLELELSNLCPGLIHSLVTCVGRVLTSANTERVCTLLNRVLDVEVAAQLSPQSHGVLMQHASLLYGKSTQHVFLSSPMPVVTLGLSNECKVSDSLQAITSVVKYHPGSTVLDIELLTQVKDAFLLHWRNDNKQVCAEYSTAILSWLSTLGEQSLSQQFCCWFVDVVREDLEFLSSARDLVMTMLTNRDKYNLTETFIEKELSLCIASLVTLPHLSNTQRHTLVQLARYTERSPPPGNKSSDSKYVTKVTHNVESSTRSPKSIKFCLRRQANITSSPDIRSPPVCSQKTPSFVFTMSPDQRATKEVHITDGTETQRGHKNMTDADRQKKLFQMDISPCRSKNTSFGDLMADIDDRATVLCGGKCSPVITRGARASSLQTPSTKETSGDVQERRTSLQAEHYRSLSAPARPNHSMQQEEKCSEDPSAKIDAGLMKSILERLDSLTAHFTSKTGLSLTEDR